MGTPAEALQAGVRHWHDSSCSTTITTMSTMSGSHWSMCCCLLLLLLQGRFLLLQLKLCLAAALAVLTGFLSCGSDMLLLQLQLRAFGSCQRRQELHRRCHASHCLPCSSAAVLLLLQGSAVCLPLAAADWGCRHNMYVKCPRRSTMGLP